MNPGVLEHDADLAGAEVVEPRLRDRSREEIADARASTARCSCGGTPTRDENGWTCAACGKPTRAPVDDLPAGLRSAIVRAVTDAGGSDDDARELEAVWRRALRDSERRTAAMLTTTLPTGDAA